MRISTVTTHTHTTHTHTHHTHTHTHTHTQTHSDTQHLVINDVSGSHGINSLSKLGKFLSFEMTISEFGT